MKKDDYDQYIERHRRDEHYQKMKDGLESLNDEKAIDGGLGYWSSYLIGRYVLPPVVALLHKTLPVWSLLLAYSILGAILLALLEALLPVDSPGDLPDWLFLLVALGAAVPVWYFREPIRAACRKAMRPAEWVLVRVAGLAWGIFFTIILFLILVQVAHLLLG